MNNYFYTLLIYFLLVNLITFILRGVDKNRAYKGKWRISEKTLLLFSLIGGFVGGVFGMQIFRHKTIKSKFLIWFWLIVAIWIVFFLLFLFNY